MTPAGLAFANPDDRDYLRAQIAPIPAVIRSAIICKYAERLKTNRQAANLWIGEQAAEVRRLSRAITSSATSEEVDSVAEAMARRMSIMRAKGADCQDIAQAIEARGIEPPDIEAVGPGGLIARAKCRRWWRRQIRKARGRTIEALAIRAGVVRKWRQPYASDDAVTAYLAQRQRNRALLERLEAENEDGYKATLAELADKSTAKPANRRAELMTRLHGFEAIAAEVGHVSTMWTITCPPRMHGSADSYDGTTPRQAQDHLRAVWARTRAALKRAGVYVYGFRVAEPHHDGCPHWHLLLFHQRAERPAINRLIRRYALAIDPDAPGSQEHRVKQDRIKGSATAYLAKYISKNIDGQGLQAAADFETGELISAGLKRVAAWASTWGIRQFQQIGGPSVTVWRELRRLEAEQADADIEAARAAADLGSWAGYVRAQGGVEVTTRTQAIRLLRVWTDEPGQYSDPIGWKITGIERDGVGIVTRLHTWEVRQRQDDDWQPDIHLKADAMPLMGWWWPQPPAPPPGPIPPPPSGPPPVPVGALGYCQ